jgi:hypothetical protein
VNANGSGDSPFDRELSLIAEEHDAGKDLQNGHGDTGCNAECDEAIEPIAHVCVDAHDHARVAREKLRQRPMIRSGCQTQ